MPRTINPYYPNQNVTRMLAGIAKQCRTIEECRTELHNENPQISQTLTLRLRKSSPLREHGVATGRALQQLVHAGRRRAPACSCRGAAAAAAAAPDPARAGGRAEVDARDGPQGTEQIGRVLLPPEHRCSLSPSTSRQPPARRCTGSGEEKRKKRPDGVPGGRRRRPDPGAAAQR